VAFIFRGNPCKTGRDGVNLNPHLLTLNVIFTFTLSCKHCIKQTVNNSSGDVIEITVALNFQKPLFATSDF